MSEKEPAAIQGLSVDIEFERPDIARYERLGLIGNPFKIDALEGEEGAECEIAAAGNALLVAIDRKAAESSPGPLVVFKADIPSQYTLRAMAHAEATLAADDTYNVLYAYLQLYMLRLGLVRGTAGLLGERLAFREFSQTLILYISRILEAPDEQLASYQAMGPEVLAEFIRRFVEDPAGATESLFGPDAVERRSDYVGAPDTRRQELPDDPDEQEATPEIDETIGEAPGMRLLLAETVQTMDPELRSVLDYIVEYTRAHLSPVLARGLRSYRERGAAQLAEELRITKAPRKTLLRLIEFASVRFRKCVFIYDSFESWLEIPEDLRASIVGGFADMRFKTSGGAFPVFVLTRGEAPEIEETFASATTLEWSFDGLFAMQDKPGEIIESVVDGWLAAASVNDDAVTVAGSGLRRVLEEADSLSTFVTMACAAIEDAADRGVDAIDDSAVQAALVAGGLTG